MEAEGCGLVLDVECVWGEDVLVAVVEDDIGIDGLRRLEIGSICEMENDGSRPVAMNGGKGSSSFSVQEGREQTSSEDRVDVVKAILRKCKLRLISYLFCII